MKPVLFSTPMVQAILDGRKTQTRRVITKKDILDAIEALESISIASPHLTPWAKHQIGDILYVRETWNYDEQANKPYYKADFDADTIKELGMKWKSSLFMPKKDARLFLKITNVRVERLQDISEEDAIAEGIKRIGDAWEDYDFKDNSKYNYRYLRAIDSYKSLWNSINKKEPEKQWEANPYVFVYEFERVAKPEASQ